MSSSWTDFNSADDQQSFDLIPKGTLVKVRMTIKPGGFDDPSRGWTGGYATRNHTTGSVYLNGEFVVLEGPYAKRRLWSLIGLHSENGPNWANMGRSFIKGILNSARGLHPDDQSPNAQNARRIAGFADLDGIEFIGKVDWEKDVNGDPKHVIKMAVTTDHRDYAAVMGRAAPAGAPSPQTGYAPAPQPHHAQAPQAAAPSTPTAPAMPNGRPSWAQ